jgi:hypothetical protein
MTRSPAAGAGAIRTRYTLANPGTSLPGGAFQRAPQTKGEERDGFRTAERQGRLLRDGFLRMTAEQRRSQDAGVERAIRCDAPADPSRRKGS